jgi:replicative DNA helicase
MALNDINIFDSDVVESGLITGIGQLDSRLGHLQDGLVTLKGKAGHGKTALALQLAKECKQSALYVSCEMAESALALRLIARLANISLNRLANKTVPSDDLKAAWVFVKESTPFIHVENGVNGYVSIDLIRDTVKKIKEKDGSNRVLVTIDSVNDWLVKAQPNFENLSKAELAKKLALELNDYAKEDGFTVLAILQDGRDKEVESAFLYVAETALSIQFERDGREDKNGIKKANVKLEKNRVGEKATIILDFEGQFQKFTE